MTALAWLGALLACGLGAVLRFEVGRLDRTGRFPWPTMTVNAVGSALLGAVAGAVSAGADPTWSLVLGGGLAGGLTTFSTLAVDVVVLAREGRRRASAAYLTGTFAGGIAAAAIGFGAVQIVAG